MVATQLCDIRWLADLEAIPNPESADLIGISDKKSFEVMKRGVDIFVSAFVLVALFPLLALTWIVVRFRLGAPVFFSQIRPGLNGEPFRMYKFRSMTNQKDEFGNLLPDEKRLTKFGSFLRSSSLDELPALWNVLEGNMSMVGPRPLLTEYLEYYNPEQQRRHEVRPGITGWAQINGRNAISWDQKLELDVWYVNNRSFWLDLYILWCTVWKVVFRKDVQPQGAEFMTRFDDSVKSSRRLDG